MFTLVELGGPYVNPIPTDVVVGLCGPYVNPIFSAVAGAGFSALGVKYLNFTGP